MSASTPVIGTTGLVSAILLFSASTGVARELTFDERVAAQVSIERVYYEHRTGRSESFERTVPRAVFERQVRDYLQRSAVLAEFWGNAVTSEMLRGEVLRMMRGTRMPERLAELFAALDDDSFLIQECLARQVLVERLSQRFFESDERIHGAARREVEGLRAAIESGRMNLDAEHPRRSVIEAGRRSVGGASGGKQLQSLPEAQIELETEAFERLRRQFPDQAARAGRVVEGSDAYSIAVLLEETSDRIKGAVYSVPRVEWASWWEETQGRFEAARIEVVADPDESLSDIAPSWTRTEDACSSSDSWDAGVLDDLPEARVDHTAVWTGSEMIVWGGANVVFSTSTGGKYDPATDSWTSTSTNGAPARRRWHSAVWTGSEMIVWGGGVSILEPYDTGGRYDPQTDTWQPMNAMAAPAGRARHVSFWTGQEMAVWGGSVSAGNGRIEHTVTGGFYDPTADSWRAIATPAVNPPAQPAVVWTGTEMIVWGGYVVESDLVDVSTGVRYRLSTDTWTSTSTVNAPSPRHGSTAVWSGSQMLVWGGSAFGYEPFRSGGRYDPLTDSWSSMSTANSPSSRDGAVWTGTEMIVWGPDPAGGRYDPVVDRWEPVSTLNAPSYQSRATAIWTGSRMILWGGQTGPGTATNLGGRYDPLNDAWTPVSEGVPPIRDFPTIAWTGAELVVWGGADWAPIRRFHKTGSRYDPVVNVWREMSAAGAPGPRSDARGVWTGSELIIWGGTDGNSRLSTGGLYDPATDTWRPVSLSNAPSGRFEYASVWTGSEMIVWGGYTRQQGQDVQLRNGARYAPVANRWTPIATHGSPEAGRSHTAVWTGREMVVWGGLTEGNGLTNSGAAYDPLTDRWRSTSMDGSPQPRGGHSAVWTGSEMLVWGGFVDSSASNTGARYDPVEDTWQTMTTVNAPAGRQDHTAIWAGREMVIWGARWPTVLNTGGRYDPSLDRWMPISTLAAPEPRGYHGAFWVAPMMLVWGGANENGVFKNDGSRYFMGDSMDADADGLGSCDGDCNDGDVSVLPGAREICDGLDQDCNGAVDEGDADLDLHAVCADCDDLDPHVSETAPEVEVAFGPFPDVLTWTPVIATRGTAHTYDIVRGSLARLPVGDDSEICLSRRTNCCSVVDNDNPDVGQAYWYLVRAHANACAGSWGAGFDGERTPTACEMPVRRP